MHLLGAERSASWQCPGELPTTVGSLPRRHVLHVSGGEGQAAPVLHWASAAEDLVHLARDGARVQLLAMAPERELPLVHSPSFGAASGLAAAASAVALQSAPGRGEAAAPAPFFSAVLQAGCHAEQQLQLSASQLGSATMHGGLLQYDHADTVLCCSAPTSRTRQRCRSCWRASDSRRCPDGLMWDMAWSFRQHTAADHKPAGPGQMRHPSMSLLAVGTTHTWTAKRWVGLGKGCTNRGRGAPCSPLSVVRS